VIFLIPSLAYDTFPLLSDRFSFHDGSFQGWQVLQFHNVYLSFAIGAYGVSIRVKNGFLNILSVTCKMIFSEYTSSVMPASLHLQNIG
jgi:hypothetical protein